MEFLPPQTQNVLCNPHKNPAIGQDNSADGGGAAQAADRGIQKAEGKRMALNKVDLLEGAGNMPGKWQLLIYLGQQAILKQQSEAAICS